MKVKIMSHNVWGMFGHSLPKVCNRSYKMQKVYHRELPDVLGTQEFSQEIIDTKLKVLIDDEYAEIDISKFVEEAGVAHLFTPMFYRPATVEVVDCGFVLYDREFNNRDSKNINWAVFRHIESGKVFTVCNTHFWWRKGDEHDAARVVNAKEVLKLLEKLPKPFVIMGDLNCRIDSEAYKTLLDGGLVDAQVCAKVTCDKTSHHMYPIYHEDTDEFTIAKVNPVATYANAIDHILIDAENADKVELFDVLQDDDSMTTSDHCPLFIELEL